MSSSSRGSRLAGKRTSAIAVITAVVAATGSVLTATPAAAAVTPATSISIDAAGQNQNVQAGTTATLNVTYAPAATAPNTPPIYFAVLGGPATSPATPAFPGPYPASNLCSWVSAGHEQCLVPNGGTAGTNTIDVFADNNVVPNATFDGGDAISGATTLIFSGVPAAVSISPASSRETAGTCVLYTARATDALGQPAVGRRVSIAVSETLTDPLTPGTITFYNIPPNTPPNCDTATQTSVAASPATGSFGPPGLLTDATGTVVFGVSAEFAGSGTVKVSSDLAPATVNNTANVTWTAGGADAVTSLAITPPSNVTQYVHTTVSYTLTATDHDGDPVQGVPVSYETDSASPDAFVPTICGTTNHLGQVTCTLTNAGSAGTDTITYWIDNGLPGPHTTGPDANEPQTVATAIFRNVPTYTLSTLTCPDQLAGNVNHPVTTCTLPTTQHAVTFTDTLTNSGVPVVGAVIQFHVTSALLGNTAATVPDGFATTDANGTATFTVNDPNAAAGDFVHVNSFIGVQFLNSASALWQTPTASLLTLTPPLQTVTKGSGVSVAAQITDQFGTPVSGVRSIQYIVSGPSAPQNGTVSTSATGGATISYTSNATTTGEDVLTATDITGGDSVPSAFADIELINGSTTASTVTVDTSGNGNSTTCPSTGTPQNINLVVGLANTQVCALVKNSNSEVLAGKTVTFTVDIGQVSGTNPVPATATKTYNATTGKNGIATAIVASTKSGTQTVTATADSASGTGTLTYALPTVDKARNIVISPVSATITAGNQQKFTWTVTDQYANPVAGATITYTQVGPGLPGGTSSGALLTAADGTASIVISTSSTDNGAGSVVGTIQQPTPPTPLNQCGDAAGNPTTTTTAGNCTASATYTVVGASPPTSLALHVASGVKKGHQETVTATVKNADGSPSANQVVRFLVTGANGLIGSAPTNAAGVATFTYVATHAGTDAISAYDDINNDQLQESNEPGHHTKAVIGGVTDKPTIHLTTFHASVTVHVATHPAMPHVLVTYYVKRYGKFVKIGTSRAGTLGRASHIFFFPKGVVRTFKARVNTKQGIKGAKTHAATITVK